MSVKIIRTATVPASLNILLKKQLRFLSNHFEVVGISSTGSDLTEVNEREGIRTVAIDMERGISPWRDLISLFKLYRQFKKEKPVIVHSITPKAGLLSMLAAKMSGVPIRIHTFTGVIFPTKSGIMQKLLIKMDQLLCWAATNIYPEGDGVKRDLLNYKITSKPLKVLANGNVNGIDSEYFSLAHVSADEQIALKRNLKILENDFVFIFVGRLVKDKGINELVTAFKNCQFANLENISHPNIVSDGVRNAKLLLVGPLEEHLDPLLPETLQEIKINHNIITTGFQQDVRPFFAVSDALVFPSYREGFPNVVMQAGAMGLPSIVTDINGCNEIVIEEENGTIIPAKDTQSLELAMKRMVADNEWRNRLQHNARPMITSRYEQQVIWEAVLEEYNALLNNDKPTNRLTN